MASPVRTKHDFVKRYAAGEFGNAAPTWQTLEQFLASGYTGLVHIRNRIAGGPTFYNVPAQDVEDQFRELLAWEEFGDDAFPPAVDSPDNLYLSGMAPTELTLFQGEVMRSRRHFELIYATVPKTMREALAAAPRYASGTMAVALLKYHLNSKSHEWLYYLLDEYPDHVVEFSVYDVCWGTVPGHNTVFWEVRTY